MSEQPREVDHTTEEDERTFTEHIEIAASDLVERTKELTEEETYAASLSATRRNRREDRGSPRKARRNRW